MKSTDKTATHVHDESFSAEEHLPVNTVAECGGVKERRSDNSRGSHRRFNISGQLLLSVAFTGFAALLCALLTALTAATMANLAREHIRSRLRDIVALSAQRIDAELHNTLTRPEQEGGAAYRKIQTSLQELQRTVEDVYYVYTMRTSPNGTIVFVVDEATNAVEIAHLGQVYDDGSEMLQTRFSSLDGPYVEEEPYTDRWGTWVSGYAPFYTADGHRAGVLGMDIGAGEIAAAQRRVVRMATLLFLCVLPFCLGLGWILARRVTAPIRWLAQEARSLIHCKPRESKRVSCITEIAELSTTLTTMRHVLNGIRDAVVATDMDGSIDYINDAGCTALGRRRQDILGDSVHSFGDDGTRGTSQENILQATRESGCWQGEVINRAPNGRNIIFNSRTQLLRDDDGTPIGIVGISTDITELKCAEKKLREKDELLNEMSRIAHIGGWNFSPATGEGTWTDEVARIHDMDPANATNLDIGLNVYKGESRSRIEAATQNAIETGEAYDLELEMTTAQGRHKWVRTIGHARRESGQTVEIAGSFQDITARKQAEQHEKQMEMQLRQSQKLAAVGTLARGAAHEINNPIMGMMNYAQLIRDTPDMTSKVREYAEEIMHEGERVAAIVRALLDFSQEQSRKMTPTRITDLVAGIHPLVEGVLQHEQITLTIDVPDNLPQIDCSANQIAKVLVTLLKNARDALNEPHPGSDENKVILLSAEVRGQVESGKWDVGRVEGQVEGGIAEGRQEQANLAAPSPISTIQNRYIRLTVEDHGPGIPAEIMERIFDPFFTTKSRSAHSGLSLAVSRAIILEHGGELSVESERGQWTRFHVDLPVRSGRKTVQ